MNHPNLPPFQRRTQELAYQFNRDERFWRSLAGRRRLRRKLMPWLTRKEHQALDRLEFSRLRPPDDCIAR
ncbi:MAG: hypothetical protein HY563_08525 [Ignavibacteriales bacterium]|nr:hypothetical protein [Ignavibacteriales bacterium]